MTVDDVARIALDLPEVTEGERYGNRTWFVVGKGVLPAQPKSFFTIPHFDGYSAVLIQLQSVGKRALREAIVDGWLACAPRQLADEYAAPGTRRAAKRR